MSVDLVGCGLHFGSPAVMQELASALPNMPDLSTLDLSRNTLCEGAEISEFAGLLPVLAACNMLTSLSLAECGLGVDAATLLANTIAEYRDDVGETGGSRQFSLSVSGNPRIMDTGMAPLLGALSRRRMISLNLSGCGIGPPSIVALAELLMETGATIKRLVLDDNPLFGTLGSKHAPGTADKYVSAGGTTEFFAGVQQSGLTELSICACGMGPATCTKLAAYIPASLSELVVARNPIGKSRYPAALRPGVEHGTVAVRAGVLAALRGRFGRVLGDPDEDDEVKLSWLDTGAESAYIASSTLGPVVSCRSELDEDYSHLSELARTAVASAVLSLDMRGCHINSIAAGTFLRAAVDGTASSSSSTPAFLEHISLATNPIFGNCSSELVGVEGDSNMRDCGQFFSALHALSTCTSLCFDDTGMGTNAAGQLVASLPPTTTSISALNNPLGTAGVQHLALYMLDVNLELRTVCGFKDGQTRVDWRSSAKGPSDLALLAIDLEAAAIGRPAAAQSLRDVALDGCRSVTGTTFTADTVVGSTESDVSELDADMSGWERFCRALCASAIIRVSLRACYVGQAAVALLAEAAGVPAELLRQQAVARSLVVVMDK